MKGHARRVLCVVESVGPNDQVSGFVPGKRIIGDADEDYVCGNCATELCTGVTGSMFESTLFLKCWGCGKTNWLAGTVLPEGRKTPEEELRMAVGIARHLYTGPRPRGHEESLDLLFGVIMNVGTRMGFMAAMSSLMSQGETFEAAKRETLSQVEQDRDPLLGTMSTLSGALTLLAAAHVPRDAIACKQTWFDAPAAGGELRVVLIGSTVRTFIIRDWRPAAMTAST